MTFPRRLASLVMLACAAVTPIATAQAPLAPGQAEMPPGHPPIADSPTAVAAGSEKPPGSADPSELPAGHPPTGKLPPGHPPTDGTGATDGDDTSASDGMPPGHPPTGDVPAGDMPAGHPATSTAGQAGMPPQDRVMPAPELGAGTVEVFVRDGQSAPVPGIEVTLVQHLHDVAEGDRVEEKRAPTDAEGRARFSGLSTESAYSFRVTLSQGGANYRSDEFRLADGAGRRVLQHVYAVEHDIRRALVGLRGIVFVEPREDVLSVEMSFQVFNIGRTTWVPDPSVTFRLPEGWKAFRARDSEDDAKLEQVGDSVRIAGTFPPGQREIGMSFQVPATGEATQTIRTEMPPHVAELRVASSIGRTATLSVDGFPEARSVRGQDGAWLAMTGKQLMRGQEPLSTLSVRLDGLRTPSQGRWVAVGLSGAIMALGLGAAFRRKPPTRGARGDADRASDMLFEELEALERLRQQDEIGPRAYERTRQTLVDALARIEAVRRASGSAETSRAT